MQKTGGSIINISSIGGAGGAGRQLQKRFAKPEDIAGAMVFLASDESSFMTAAVVPAEAGHSAW
jgi:hypothetical protein